MSGDRSKAVDSRSHVVHYGPGIDNILSMTVHGGTTQTYYYVKDHLGSVLALTDSSGSIVESYQYDAWGNTSVFDGSGNPLQQSQIGNRFAWQGREIYWATRLYYFRARWYDPVTARWLSNDPIGISDGLNQYVFCDNNPVNFVDPLGLCGDEPYDPSFNGDATLDWINAMLMFINPSRAVGLSTEIVISERAVLEMHHLLPRTFINYFERAGLNIEEYKIPLERVLHRLKPCGIHTGAENWNKVWMDFFRGYRHLVEKRHYSV